MDLLDLWRGRLTWRRVKSLIAGLPLDSAVCRADPELAGWTLSDHLLATIAETVDLSGWRAVSPHLKRGAAPKPLRIPRPGAQRRRARPATGEALRALGGVVTVTGGDSDA